MDSSSQTNPLHPPDKPARVGQDPRSKRNDFSRFRKPVDVRSPGFSRLGSYLAFRPAKAGTTNNLPELRRPIQSFPLSTVSAFHRRLGLLPAVLRHIGDSEAVKKPPPLSARTTLRATCPTRVSRFSRPPRWGRPTQVQAALQSRQLAPNMGGLPIPRHVSPEDRLVERRRFPYGPHVNAVVEDYDQRAPPVAPDRHEIVPTSRALHLVRREVECIDLRLG
jgi:hypothetical protein